MSRKLGFTSTQDIKRVATAMGCEYPEPGKPQKKKNKTGAHVTSEFVRERHRNRLNALRENGMVSIGDAAAELGISKRKLYRKWLDTGKIQRPTFGAIWIADLQKIKDEETSIS